MTIDQSNDAAIFMQDFAETIRFRSKPGGMPRAIDANVYRQPIDDGSATPYPGKRPPLMHVMARNSETFGIHAGEVIDDQSEIYVDYPQGSAFRWRKVVRLVRQNPAFVIVEVRA